MPRLRKRAARGIASAAASGHRAALLLGNDAQTDDARVIIELALEIGCGQRRVPNSLDLQHRHSPRSAMSMSGATSRRDP